MLLVEINVFIEIDFVQRRRRSILLAHLWPGQPYQRFTQVYRDAATERFSDCKHWQPRKPLLSCIMKTPTPSTVLKQHDGWSARSVLRRAACGLKKSWPGKGVEINAQSCLINLPTAIWNPLVDSARDRRKCAEQLSKLQQDVCNFSDKLAHLMKSLTSST